MRVFFLRFVAFFFRVVPVVLFFVAFFLVVFLFGVVLGLHDARKLAFYICEYAMRSWHNIPMLLVRGVSADGLGLRTERH